ncbi:UNVERIFIED_CONTAM: hypothetical protein FKN15_075249 [Acipenser sinensis]
MERGSYMMVDSSQHDSGEKARIQLPVMKENDTHCIDFNYLLYTKDGSSPGTLNILVKVNKGPLANPIWNVTSFTGRDWLRAELAVSTFWPNEYQVSVSKPKIILKDKSPHFLRLGDVEVNAGQNATFQCIATGRDAVNNKLWLQKRHGEDIPVAQTKNINHRRFAASFRLREVTNLDQDLYRCVTQSDRGSGVSNFAELIVREPPRPIAPPQLLGVGPTYLLIQLNANSIFGDGPIILKEVEYRMTSGSWIETHAVNAPNYKLWHLDPDTEYEIRVLLTRPGEGGTGQSGPPLITRTKCAVAHPVKAYVECKSPECLFVLAMQLESLFLVLLWVKRLAWLARLQLLQEMIQAKWLALQRIHQDCCFCHDLFCAWGALFVAVALQWHLPRFHGWNCLFPPACIRIIFGKSKPMRTPKSLKIAETQARFIAVDWESLGYNITRCHTFNVTICYHYFHSNNESKADCLDMDPKAPRHVVGNLPPYTNVSLKMILTNPEGRKESDEVVIQTDEDVPNPVPSESMKAMPFEDKIFLHWKEPLEPNGVITQYEISYSSIRSFDPAVDVAKRPLTVALPWNSTHHVFSQLHPGTTYQFIIRASTVKGFGPPTVVNVTTNISAPSIPDYDMTETCLNETATTITVLLKPATAKGAPISAYQIVVEELNPHRNKREASSLDCYQVPVTYQSAASGGSPYYFAAELPPGSLPDPAPFTVGDNKTYNGFWNPPLAPRKNYNIYFQAVSSVEKQCRVTEAHLANTAGILMAYMDGILREAPLPEPVASVLRLISGTLFQISLAATEEPEVIPDPAKQTEVVKIAGISAGVLVFILLLLVVILVIKKRKLAKKRKDVIGTTRQEMTHMVNAMDRSYADQSTLHAEDPLAVTFMDSHNFSNRYENHTAAAAAESSRLLDVPRYHCEGTESPYQTGQLHPAIRVADLLQHINLMKTSDSYGFKEEYESFFEGQSASWDVAKKEQNRTKNRYGNIIAYDHSRVILQPMEDDPSSDYINANYIDGYQRPSHYIATQGPVHETVYDFWRMIWQEQSACVVMVTNLVEVGRVKCYKYWPDDADVYGDFKVTFLEVEPLAEYVVRTFTLERRGFNEMREVKQFNFTGWPDHGVPYHATGLLSFIRRVKMSNPPSAGPIVVHCSAGAGRTGCYIVIDIMLDMAEREGVVDIYNCVKALRSRRINMVQTEEQYIFIHDAILEACLCGETTIPACEFKATYYDMIRIDSQSNSSHLKDEFQTLNSVTPQPQPEDCSIALLPRNHEKNRFMDMLPPDRCLPFLITIDGESSNYISAALMDSYRQPAAFIITQHPLPNTVKDFWRLVYDYGCTSLVMLNEIDLAQGCPQYWPEEGILRYGPIQVECMSCSMDCDVISRLFRICNLTRPQEGYLMVRQFQYLGWASHREVPASKRSFLKLILQVDKWQDECEEGEGRTIIHCLNGGGRSGMFCAISIVCEMIKRQNVVDVFHAVKSLRNSKSNMVESPTCESNITGKMGELLIIAVQNNLFFMTSSTRNISIKDTNRNGSVYEMFGNECCLPTGEVIKIIGLNISKLSAEIQKDGPGSTCIELPLDYPVRKDIVHIPSSLDVEVIDVTDMYDINSFVQPLSINDIFNRPSSNFPIVAEIIEGPEHTVESLKFLRSCKEVIIHQAFQAKRILASEIRSDAQKHFLIPYTYSGKFKRRPREFPTAYDLEIAKSDKEQLHVVATKAFESHYEGLSTVSVGDQFLVQHRKISEVVYGGTRKTVEALACEKIEGKGHEPVLIPMCMEGGFVEVIHDKKQYHISEICQKFLLPFNVKVAVRDLSIGEDILATMLGLHLEEEITEPCLLITPLKNLSECWEIPVNRIKMSLQLLHRPDKGTEPPPVKTVVEEISEDCYYTLRRYVNATLHPPPRPPKKPLQPPSNPFKLEASQPKRPDASSSPKSPHVNTLKPFKPIKVISPELQNAMAECEFEKITATEINLQKVSVHLFGYFTCKVKLSPLLNVFCPIFNQATTDKVPDMLLAKCFDLEDTAEVCALVKCKNPDIKTCGEPVKVAPKEFENFSLSGTFGTKYLFPEVQLSGVDFQVRSVAVLETHSPCNCMGHQVVRGPLLSWLSYY